ncbi:MAG: hypothetical protein IPH44_13670, partial [Myxococcales bacterium]|nr:hypothetical protein [Myxococcales bacterium]
ADVSFQVGLCASGRMLRAIVGAIRVHGHLPTPAPLVVQRLIEAIVGDDDAATPRRSAAPGLCEWVIDVAGWPPGGCCRQPAGACRRSTRCAWSA